MNNAYSEHFFCLFVNLVVVAFLKVHSTTMCSFVEVIDHVLVYIFYPILAMCSDDVTVT